MSALIDARGVHHAFRSSRPGAGSSGAGASAESPAPGFNEVLHDVDLRVRAGELVSVLGPNGAGKTTLARVVSGVLRPSRGAVEIGGRPVSSLSRREVAHRLAVVPQEGTVPFPYEVHEMVSMGRAPRLGPLGRLGEADRAAVRRALEQLGLTDLAARRYPTLSGGEKQRVLLARALAQEAPALLLDEPTAHMDLGHRLFAFEQIRDWVDEIPAERGALVVSHDLSLAARFADRVLVLHRGHLAAEGSPAEALTAELIARVYGAEARVETDATGRPTIVALRSRIRYIAEPDARTPTRPRA
jgi:iron complex transport system ATP-binding protein